MDLKKPWTAEQAYVMVGTSGRGGMGEGSRETAADSRRPISPGVDNTFWLPTAMSRLFIQIGDSFLHSTY